MNIDAYVDADFAGLYSREPDHLPAAAQSRTGYVISIAGCPTLWKSQLQSEIALSTTHDEYVALSQCMRVVLPLIDTVRAVLSAVHSKLLVSTTFHAEVFEDNNGAQTIATT